MKNSAAKVAPFAATLLPLFAFAQSNTNADLGFVDNLVTQVGDLVALLIPVVIAIGLLFFLWGLVQYIAASGDEAAKEEGKRKMIWGVIALFVIVSVWGLVALVGQLTGVNQGSTFAPVNTGLNTP